MGLYIEPETDKLEWCKANGKFLVETTDESGIDLSEFEHQDILVCLVDNGFFMAGAVVYNIAEYNCFNTPDGRNKYWFKFTDTVLKPVCPLWNEYIGKK